MKTQYRNASRKIAICADHDAPNNEISTEGGTGVHCAREAAKSIGCNLINCPPVKDGKGDFNDLHQAKGLEAVKEIVESAFTKEPEKIVDSLPVHYVQIDKRIFLLRPSKKPGGNPSRIFVCSKFKVLGLCRDNDNKRWAIYVQFSDPDGNIHSRHIHKSDLVGPNRHKVLAMLLDDGALIGESSESREAFFNFLSAYDTKRRIRTTSRTGWMGNCFVLPDEVFGSVPHGEHILLDRPSNESFYKRGGSPEKCKEIAELCVGNYRLAFTISFAFAGALLNIAKMESGGFHFYGPSSTSKTTLLYVIASVLGVPVFSWRATTNAMEGRASLLSDSCLLLDELGQGYAGDVSIGIYSLANGTEKGRMDSDIQLRDTKTWVLMICSTGECTTEDKVREGGGKIKAGQQVRLTDIPIDKSDIKNLHGYTSADEMVRALKKLSSENYGYPYRDFLKHLTAPHILERIRENIDTDLDEIVGILCDQSADGQVQRVARRFALVAIAGKLAIEFGILPADINPVESVKACFSAWLEARGGSGPMEDMQILSQFRLFIEAHGSDSFRDEDSVYIRENDTENQTITFPVVRDMVGFRKINPDDMYSYYILPESFEKIMAGHHKKRALKVLHESGWLIKQDENRYKTKRKFYGYRQIEVYHFKMPKDDIIQG